MSSATERHDVRPRGDDTTAHRPHVVVAGGGIAGIEALLALRALAGDRVTLELLAPEPDLVMRPLAVAAPFGSTEVRRFPLEQICEEQGVRLRPEALEFADVAGRAVETTSGERVAFDALVLAVGARRHEAVAGALTFDGAAGIAGFRRILQELRDGEARSLVLVVPDGISWALPLYELAMMTARAVEGAGVRLTLVTPERDPLEVFGPAVCDRVLRLLGEHRIDVHRGASTLRLTDRFLLTSTGAIPAERVVALPVLDGPRVPGVPHDAHGFLEVDEHGAVRGAPGVYAAGDGTAQPIKQGGLAAQQADAIAAAIAAAAGASCEPMPFRPVLRAQLLTGALPWFLRASGEVGGTSSTASITPLWPTPGKVVARYLGPYLAGQPEAQPLSGKT